MCSRDLCFCLCSIFGQWVSASVGWNHSVNTKTVQRNAANCCMNVKMTDGDHISLMLSCFFLISVLPVAASARHVILFWTPVDSYSISSEDDCFQMILTSLAHTHK